MKFEHLVQVNDINNPSDFSLTRSQLWEGLLWRVREPNQFLVAIDSFKLLEEKDNYLKRELHFPGSVVLDEVFLENETSIRYEIMPDKNASTTDVARASLTMQIEEPELNSLFVRFIYQVEQMNRADSNLSYDEVVQQAYVGTDLETIRLIKQRFQQALSTH